MTKRLAMAFGLGAALPLLGALWLGGENLAQAGFRLAAIEQGFALASRHWQFEATPAHEIELARWDAPENASGAARKAKPAPKPAPKRR
ncbi:MAG: hypothetical protein OZ922_15880 [Myxococcales bacterium]|jgi:hypothetical protein|nr:hypothetical protein [Myxococcales bacterium]